RAIVLRVDQLLAPEVRRQPGEGEAGVLNQPAHRLPLLLGGERVRVRVRRKAAEVDTVEAEGGELVDDFLEGDRVGGVGADAVGPGADGNALHCDLRWSPTAGASGAIPGPKYRSVTRGSLPVFSTSTPWRAASSVMKSSSSVSWPKRMKTGQSRASFPMRPRPWVTIRPEARFSFRVVFAPGWRVSSFALKRSSPLTLP